MRAPVRRIGPLVAGQGFDAADPAGQGRVVALHRQKALAELGSDALVRFPMLLGAPGIIAIVWSGLFDRFEPLDVRAMMRAYFDNLFGTERAA